jgi:hypothetical protein
MSLLLNREWQGGIVRGGFVAPEPSTYLDLLDDPALALISHWRLNEDTGPAFADRMARAGMAATGDPQRLPRALVNNDVVEASIALDGSSQFLRAVNPASKPYDVTAGAIGAVIQPDTVTGKRAVLNRGTGGAIAGATSLEILDGGRLRGWRYDGGGTLREVLSTIGAVTAGDARLVLLSWGPAGLLLYLDSQLIGAAAITDWAVNASFNSDVWLGQWPTGIERFDGVLAHAFILGAQPTGAQVSTLARAASFSWAENIDIDFVEVETNNPVNLKTVGAHFKAPIVPAVVTQGSLGTASVNSEEIDFLAGSIAGTDDGFTYRFTSANGTVSPNATVTVDVVLVDEFPLTLSGTKIWFQTNRSDVGAPAQSDPIESLLNVEDGATLFTQPTEGLRGTWDETTFDVPMIRGNGTTQHYLSAAGALAPPGILIVCGSLDADATGFHAFAGTRSTQTSSGDAKEEAWCLNNTNTGTMRAVVAGTTGVAFTDTSQALAEKLLVVMRVEGTTLTIWRNGFKNVAQTVPATRLTSDGEQAVLAKYYDNALTAFLKGGIAILYQNSVPQTPTIVRELIEYFQGEWFPDVAPPPSQTLDAGDVQQGLTFDYDVIGALEDEGIDTTNMILASIDEQPTNSGVTVSVVGGRARIVVAAGATLGNFSFVSCVQESNA